MKRRVIIVAGLLLACVLGLLRNAATDDDPVVPVGHESSISGPTVRHLVARAF